MPKRTPNRRLSYGATFGILLVAVAVFGWGLRYKLSLYHPVEKTSNSGLHAKLLSQKERPVPNQIAGVDRPATWQPQRTELHPALLPTIASFALHVVSFLRAQDTARGAVRQLQDSVACNFFFFRPPPSAV